MSAPEKTPEEKDEEELREVEAKIKEVLALMGERHTRAQTDEKLAAARARRDEHHGNRQSVFYRVGKVGKGGQVATTLHTQSHLELGEVLKTRIQLGQYAANLEDTLRRLSERHVEVLERILSRSRY
jgi:hypothetical protein